MVEQQEGSASFRRPLLVMSVAVFMSGAGMSLVIPFLPLYLQDLGVTDPAAVSRWAGYLTAFCFLAAAFTAPLWGALGDRYGRKPMVLRAVAGLSVCIGLMAFASKPEHLLILRIIQGATSGFIAASIALIASMTPRKQMGYALGTLQTAVTAGHVIGPLLGGRLADWWGYSHVFLITSGLCLTAGIVVAVMVKENFTPAPPNERPRFRDSLRLFSTMPALLPTFAVIFLCHVALMVIQPILPLFAQSLAGGNDGLLRTKVGLVFSVPGFAAALAAPFWGRRGDRYGYPKTLALTLLGAGLLYLPQALSASVFQLALMRFGMGLFTAGINPTAQSIVASAADDHNTASALSLLNTAQLLGNVAGPLMGGCIAAHLGARPVFTITGTLLLLSGGAAWRAATCRRMKGLYGTP